MSRRLPHVDQAATDGRAAWLAGRVIGGAARPEWIRLASSLVDLTTLEGNDTASVVRALAAKARRPDPQAPELPACAAVCVYPALVAGARHALAGSDVRVASVTTGFPAGQTSLAVKLQETEEAIAAGAQEIDMVISRGAFLSGDDRSVLAEIERVKAVCGPEVHLKVILETGELGSYAHIRHAAALALAVGADFLKTSTGKIGVGATPGAVLVLLEAVRAYAWRSGRLVGVKAAGGVRTTRQALALLTLVKETVGEEWLRPERFRIGASSLLDDLVREHRACAASELVAR
jgi:deoxyribose-phosphate aldolase